VRRSIFYNLVRKEFAHVFRDRKTLLILFGMPVVQIIIFGFALTNEVRDASVLIVDHARDEVSRAIVEKMRASEYFDVEEVAALRDDEVRRAFQSGRARLAVVFPPRLGTDLQHFGNGSVQIIADASDPNSAQTLTSYFTQLLIDYQRHLSGGTLVKGIRTEVKMLYNPRLEGAHNFVPGVMALVLMIVCVLMTSVSIVREKQTGTMEVLLVSPTRPELVILSKAVPYLLLSIVNILSILLLSVFVLNLPIAGNAGLLLMVSIVFIITSLSLGLLISVKAETQEAAMLVALLGMFLPTLLFSGFMFPIENMPLALQYFSNVVPAKWYYLAVQDIMLKGSGFRSIWQEVLILSVMTLLFLVVSLKNFRTRLA